MQTSARGLLQVRHLPGGCHLHRHLMRKLELIQIPRRRQLATSARSATRDGAEEQRFVVRGLWITVQACLVGC